MKISFSRVLWGLICLGVGLFFLAGSWGSYAEYQRVQNYEGRAVGHITNKHFKLGSDGGGNYYVDYWFMPSTNSKISATGMIAKQQWEILKVDDTFEIRYDRSNPNLNIPMYGGSPSLVFSFFMFILGAVFILFGSLRLVSGFKKASYGKSN
ncbi:MAG: DUF3592 domain-containing protein [Smithella sp.]|nr:DUF3592 domain-containing protein [Smithella sp.]